MRLISLLLIVSSGLSASCASASSAVDVKQCFRKPVCTLNGCKMEEKVINAAGRVIGQADDGTWIVITGARGRTKGIAFVDLRNGTAPLEGKIVAVDARLNLSLAAVRHSGALEADPLTNPQYKAWVASQLGRLPRGAAPVAAAQAPDVEEAPPAPAPPTSPPKEPAAQAATAIDVDQFKSEIAAAVKTETAKLLQEHKQEMLDAARKQAAENTEGIKGLPAAFIGLLKTFGPGILKEAMKDFIPQITAAAPSLLNLVLAVGGGIALPGAGGLAIAGWLVARVLKKHTTVLSAIATHLGRHSRPNAADSSSRPPPAPPSTDKSSSLPQSSPATVAAQHEAPEQTIVEVQVADPLGLAMQQAETSILKNNPSIKLLDALPQIKRVAQTILDLRKPFTTQPATTGDLLPVQ
jgi:hypothetical protein